MIGLGWATLLTTEGEKGAEGGPEVTGDATTAAELVDVAVAGEGAESIGAGGGGTCNGGMEGRAGAVSPGASVISTSGACARGGDGRAGASASVMSIVGARAR